MRIHHNPSPETVKLAQESVPVERRLPLPPLARADSKVNGGLLTILSFIAVSVFWGPSAPAIRYTTWFISPFWMLVLRFSIAGGLLFFGLSVAGKRPKLASVPRVLPSGIALSVAN